MGRSLVGKVLVYEARKSFGKLTRAYQTAGSDGVVGGERALVVWSLTARPRGNVDKAEWPRGRRRASSLIFQEFLAVMGTMGGKLSTWVD